MIRIDRFNGERWSVDAFRLGAQYATRAENVWLTTTGCNPLLSGERAPVNLGLLNANFSYQFYDRFLFSTSDLDPQWQYGPSNSDSLRRLYYLKNDQLTMIEYSDNLLDGNIVSNSSRQYSVGVPTPIPTVFPAGSDFNDPGTTQVGGIARLAEGETAPDDLNPNLREVVFVYTYVNELGEEGPPSFPSNPIKIIPGQTKVEVDVIHTRLNVAYAGIRLYMSYQGLYFRVSQPEVTGVFEAPNVTHTVPNLTSLLPMDSFGIPVYEETLMFTASQENLLDQLISTEWVGPPKNVKYLISLDGGVLVLADDQRIYLSEPYFPHAFPVEYTLRVSENITGLAKVDNGFVVLTDDQAHLFLGSDPAYIQEVPLDFRYPCLDRRSITPYGNGIIYATTDGIAYVSSNEARILSEGWIDRNEWNQRVTAGEFIGEIFEGRYMVMTRDDQNIPRGYAFNLSEGDVTQFTIPTESLKMGWHRFPTKNELWYVIDNDGAVIFNKGDPLQTNWISGKVEIPNAMSYAAARMEVDDYIPAPDQAILEVHADTDISTQIVGSNRPFHIKGTGRKRFLQLCVKAYRTVSLVRIGRDIREV